MKFTEWLSEQPYYGLCPPPLTAQEAVNFLCDYLLGKDWYVVMPLNTEQVNSEIVFAILDKYSKRFRKECKGYLKGGD